MTTASARSLIVFAVALSSAAVVMLLGLWYLAEIWLLAFAGILLAVVMRGLGEWFAAHTGLGLGWSVGSIWVLLLLLLGLLAWFIGPTFLQGIDQLTEQLPQAERRLREFIAAHPEIERVLRREASADGASSWSSELLDRLGGIFSTAIGFLSGVTGAVVGLLVVVIIALYGSLDPDPYVRGMVALLPASRAGRLSELLGRIAHTLRRWMAGRLASMALVGMLTWVGLLLLGVPAAAALAIIAALLSFIPNIGPILSAVPAVLTGLTISPTMAVSVVALYVAVQTVESYLLTPMIQQHMVSIPPAAVILVQLVLGAAFGFLGVLLAMPLAVVAMLVVRDLWVERKLGNA